MIYIPCLREHVMIVVEELSFYDIYIYICVCVCVCMCVCARVCVWWGRGGGVCRKTVCMQHHQAKRLGAWFYFYLANDIDFRIISIWRVQVIHVQQLHFLYPSLPNIPQCLKWVYICRLWTQMMWYNCWHFKVSHVASCPIQFGGPCSYLTSLRSLSESCLNGPLARYVKLRVAHAPGIPGTFSPPPRG